MNQDFASVLEENVKDYNGEFKEVILNAPKLYSLATELLKSSEITGQFRMQLLAAVGYFLIPDDIFPEEEHGPIGYVEDIMLLQYIFRNINSELGKAVLINAWNHEEELLKELLGSHYLSLKEKYKWLHNDVIKFIGLE